MTYPTQPNYGAPQYQQPQQPMQYPQGPAPQQQYAPAPQQTYAAPPTQPQYQQPGGTGGFFTQQDPHTQAQQQQYAPAAPPQFQQPPPMPAQPVDTSSFFGGAATISWDASKGYRVGTFRGGQILDKKIVPQTKLGTNEILKWGDGSVREQMVLTLQTAERTDPQDNGQRQMFLKGDAPRAAREAFQAANAKDLELGGWYYQAWVDEKAPKQAGYNPQKVFKGVYAPPGSPDPMAGQQVFTPQPAAPAMPEGPAMSNWPNPQVVNGVPQPHATPDQFAAYAAQQANQQQGATMLSPRQPDESDQQYLARLQAQQPIGPQQSYQGQQQAPQSNGQHPEQVQQFAQPVTPQGQAPQSGYNPFGPTG